MRWERDDASRVPFMTYTDEALYREELERFFYRGHWCYVGLEAEVPEVGDFKRTVVGERSVIMVRSAPDAIHVIENVCAHRGMACRFAVACVRTARSTAACRPISRPRTMA
jgi:salicylate 5-hydroxylase large subunit